MPVIVAFLVAVTSAPLAPAGPWNVNAGVSSCLLSRDFSQVGDRVTVVFDPMFTSPSIRMTLIAVDTGRASASGKAEAQVVPGGGLIHGTYESRISPSTGKRLTGFTLPTRLLSDIGHGGELVLTSQAAKVRLVMNGADRAVAAVAECERRLLRSWNIDPARLSVANPPQPRDPLSAMPSAYPPEALRRKASGRATAMVSIDRKGGAEACRVIVSAGEPLDKATCAAGSRMRFKPATDAAGQAVPSIYLLLMNWNLPI